MCLYPRLINNKKYTKNKKNGGIIPAIFDERVLTVPTACGDCIECRKKKAREWQTRMLEDIRHNKNGKFVTLTFSNEEIKKLYEEKGMEDFEGYEKDNKVATVAVRRFNERWRKKTKKAVRHWLITEIGHKGTENIHLHGIIWTDTPEEIEKKWMYGHVWIGDYVSERTVNYIIKYVTKKDEYNKTYKSRILTSAGIGGAYINRKDAEGNKYKEGNTNEGYTTRTGHKTSLPIYYRNKIYTDEEREKLWIEKLDQNIRWVNGIRIDITNGMEEYYRELKIAQEKSKRLGYGDGKTDWTVKKYEQERRKRLQDERKRKAKA